MNGYGRQDEDDLDRMLNDLAKSDAQKKRGVNTVA
jgi:hypothetical protein